MIDAVVFDLDGVLLDSEQVWDQARQQLVAATGGRWSPRAQRDMMGMSSPEWSRYLHDELAVPLAPEQISDAVVDRVLASYRKGLPLLPGAVGAVRRLAADWPLGLASSSNRPVIDAVLRLAGLISWFAVTVSSEEVARGKPAPDVYLEAARRLGCDPARCAAVEDSTNGLWAALAARMRVVAVPNRAFPPDPDVVARAAVVVEDLTRLTPALVDPTGAPDPATPADAPPGRAVDRRPGSSEARPQR